jgi:trans-aconitate methyltransferase
MAENPIDLLFGGMEKLGPGSNEHTLNVLRLLPQKKFDLIVDAGCGTGRQTLALAKELQTQIHAVDSYQPFLTDLAQRAKTAALDQLIKTHCIDLKEIPDIFRDIDLLWSEGAAYNIRFSNALKTWVSAIKKNGFLVVSELSWLGKAIPNAVKEFFTSAYPDMQSIQQNLSIIENAGYKMLTTYTLPNDTWVEGYYDVLEPRAKSLIKNPDPAVRDFAQETLKEIEIFRVSEDSFGYVFYLLQRK